MQMNQEKMTILAEWILDSLIKKGHPYCDECRIAYLEGAKVCHVCGTMLWFKLGAKDSRSASAG
jgi:hypothetical protein